MKNKITVLLIIAIAIFIYLVKFNCYRTLPEITNYKIVSNLGKPIPAKLYSREVRTTIKGESKTINEILICFNDSLILNKSNLKSNERLGKFLLVIPDLELIGLVNNPNDSFKINNDCICQIDKGGDEFTSIINNYAFFTNPPIKKVSFTKGKIIFNSYGILKQFGESIIIEVGSFP